MMTGINDNFPAPELNAKYLPTYPSDFFDFIDHIIEDKLYAWDCGTGNGQAAIKLAETFKEVFATDTSVAAIANSFTAPNIHYSIQPAEQTNFNNHAFDLIVASNAVHDFNLDQFYTEAIRTLRPDGIICLIGFNRFEVSPEIDQIILNFYDHVLENCWGATGRYSEQDYATLYFPFYELDTPIFANERRWTLEQLIGYLNTLPAVKNFIQMYGSNPVNDLYPQIKPSWGERELRKVYFPLFLRMGMKLG